jgi:3-dehydro-L-gulonate 2-dehydrogenase
MPPWGGKEPRLGNNPLVIAIPRKDGHIVLDMAMSQFSYGKLQEYELRGSDLPVAGGYDEEGELTANPFAIRASRRTLPIGFWKGSGLSFILDVLVASLSGGRSVAAITANGREFGLSQIFVCFDGKNLHEDIIESIIAYAKSSAPAQTGQEIFYPGEKTLAIRRKSEAEGIEVNEEIWNQILAL